MEQSKTPNPTYNVIFSKTMLDKTTYNIELKKKKKTMLLVIIDTSYSIDMSIFFF